MAELSVQTTSRTGLNPTYQAAAGGGDEFANAGSELLHIKNGGVGAVVLTIQTPNTVDGLAVADRTVSIPAGEERIIGPFPTGTYNDGTGKVQLTYDGVTSLTVAVLKTGV